MTRTQTILLRLVLAVTCAYHLGVGVAAWVAPQATIQFGQAFYGVEVTLVPQIAYMLKAMGMYALFTGGLLVLATWNPVRFRHVAIAAVALLLMRATTRVVSFDLLHEAFGVTWGRNLTNVVILTVQSGVILWGLGPAPATAEEAAPLPTPVRVRPTLPRFASSRLEPCFASASSVREGYRSSRMGRVS